MCIRDRNVAQHDAVLERRAVEDQRRDGHQRVEPAAGPVSYTHLDVYKRQGQSTGELRICRQLACTYGNCFHTVVRCIQRLVAVISFVSAHPLPAQS